MIRFHTASLAFAALVFAAPSADADTIYLLDGSSIQDASVEEETLSRIEYRHEGRTKGVDAKDVLRVEYDEKPPLVDRADDAAQQGELASAIGDLETYVQGTLAQGGEDRRYPWAPAYALARLIELNRAMGNLAGVVSAADRMIANLPNARQRPDAHLAKANAQYRSGDAAAAGGTLDALEALAQKEGLSRQWVLEVQLGRVMYDSALEGDAKRAELRKVAVSADGEFPVVASRAKTFSAESLVDEKKYAEAEEVFREVAESGKADRPTLAAAYTGLGDCLMQRGERAGGEEKQALLKDALLAYMRVVVVYEDQTQYVPKAMFYAARIFDQSEDEVSQDRAQRLYGTVIYRYEGSRWAREANGFRR